MYRKRNGSLGFSFTKLAHATTPNFSEDPTRRYTPVLSLLSKDLLHSHQLASPDVYSLDEHAFRVAGVVDSDRLSRTVHKALTRHQILSNGHVDTYRIGPDFTNQLAALDRWRQKQLVNLLFWWEEECHRLRKLGNEDAELGSLIAEAERFAREDPADVGRRERVDQLRFARERVRMKVRQRPSQRRPDTEADTDDLMEWFRGRAASAPTIMSGGHAGGQGGDEMLPDYSPRGVSIR